MKQKQYVTEPKRLPRISYAAGITRFEEPSRRVRRFRLTVLFVLGLFLLWLGIPLIRAGALLFTNPLRHTPARPAGLIVEPVRFRAVDGVSLDGWLVPASSRVPTVILVGGFKADRTSMVPYAGFLHAAGFNAFLYDSRGTGGSSGMFSLGLREVKDVQGAVAYLNSRAGSHIHRYGLLGVSLGAGVAIVAASRLPEVHAIVADSPYTDQRAVVQRLDTMHAGPLTLAMAPVAPWLVDQLIGAPLDSFSPLRGAAKLGGRPLLLIHSEHKQNPTTPLGAALALKHAAGKNATLWIAPLGGHAGALAAQPAPYRQRVVTFLRHYLH